MTEDEINKIGETWEPEAPSLWSYSDVYDSGLYHFSDGGIWYLATEADALHSAAIAALKASHEAEIAAKDAEIARLTSPLQERTASLEAALAERDEARAENRDIRAQLEVTTTSEARLYNCFVKGIQGWLMDHAPTTPIPDDYAELWTLMESHARIGAAVERLREDPAMIETLAALTHAQWSGWMKYLFTCGYKLMSVGTFTIERASVLRWERQMATDYADLPEAERESDREEARRMLRVFLDALESAINGESK